MTKKKQRATIFGDIKEQKWEKEWQGMPEYLQEEQTPFRSMQIHFRNEQDLIDFFKLIKQKFTDKTKYIWYPKLIPRVFKNKRYVDENDERYKK